MKRGRYSATTWALLLIGFSAFQARTEEVSYGVASWPEPGRGNHRAVVRVAESVEAVRVHIPWRRRDRQPETKDLRVFDPRGQRVLNVAMIAVSRAAGDLAFQPTAGPGDYEVYYLPYNPPTGNFDDPGTYFPPRDSAEAAWRTRNHLQAEAIAAGRWRSLPEAKVVALQARGEFHRRDPMELIATEEEIQTLLAACPSDAYLLFPEDRARAVRMFDDLPRLWTQRGPGEAFAGKAQPGEYYPFQVAVWAAREAIADVDLEFQDLHNDRGKVIPAANLTCFNLGGTDWLGRPMKRPFPVGQGQVRPLWIGVTIPADAQGVYRGQLTVHPTGKRPRIVRLQLEVGGPVLPDGGVSDLRRLSRLKWLNSTLGLDDAVIPPFTPLLLENDHIDLLDRRIRFDGLGLPESLVSRGREILAGPVRLVAQTGHGAVRFEPTDTAVPKRTAGTIERVTAARSVDGLAWSLRSVTECDGCLMFLPTLAASKDVALEDVRLEIPLRRDVARYMMGMRKRGGVRETPWRWKWNIDKADNQLWLGDVDAGLQLHLRGPRDTWDVVTLRDSGLPEAWANGGQGGCEVNESGEAVLVKAFSGRRTLRAGQSLTFAFRLLVTPFKRIDPRHWSWRHSDPHGDGTILHIHHGGPPNSFINYPFLETAELAAVIREVRALRKECDFGQLTYPAAGHVNLTRGSLHVPVKILFDPAAGEPRQARFNQEFFDLDFPGGDQLGFYWNVDVRGMRAYFRQGPPEKNQYPGMADAPAPQWKQGQRHLLSLSWGEELAIAIDGQPAGHCPLRGLPHKGLEGATLRLSGAGFAIESLHLRDESFSGGTSTMAADAHTLLLDRFRPGSRPDQTRPERAAGGGGTLVGAVEATPTPQGRVLHFSSRPMPGVHCGVNLYYTVRELSNHVAELWPLRSMGDEVFSGTSTFIYSVEKTMFGKPGGGYPWLQEHLVRGYVPAWRQPLPGGETDAALGTQGLSRWHNYYVEGLQWLMRTTGLDGLYLDGIGYDRQIMKRVAKVMYRNNPQFRINFHSGNNYDFMNWQTSPMNSYMEHLPYITSLWIGEMYDYNRPPDYWLVEISGIPFGLTSEMLEYQTGGNPYRGMLYGMSGRQLPGAAAMWRFWDEFGIAATEMLGYWDTRCPVHTGRNDVLATVYRKPGAALVALASWAPQKVDVRLAIDWAALGLDPKQATLVAPPLDHFQASATFVAGQPVPVEPGKGWLLRIETPPHP